MKNEPLISVLMPVFNASLYLREAIESILQQTYKNLELIVIDDCSTDDSLKIIKGFDDPRIILLQNDKNSGISRSLNKGIQRARGTYIARMDADDISLPDRFRLQVEYLQEHPEVDLLATSVIIFGEKQGVGFSCPSVGHFMANMLFNNCICHPSVMGKGGVFKEHPYNPLYDGLEDYEYWCRLSEKVHFAFYKHPLLKYRISPKQVSSNYGTAYIEKFVAYKKEQMCHIGVEDFGDGFVAFCDVCLSRFQNTPQQLQKLDGYFWKIYSALSSAKSVHLRIIKHYFVSIISKHAAELSSAQKKQLGHLHFLSRIRQMLSIVKNFLRHP